MEQKILAMIQAIDMEAEIRDTFQVTVDQIETIFINQDGLTIEIIDYNGEKKALQYRENWPTEIMAYFGYYWFNEWWLNWDTTCLYLLKRCAFFEPGLQRFVFQAKNNICKDQCDSPQRFWTFKFTNFSGHDVAIQPFKQIVKGKDYVSFSTFIVPIAK